MFEAIDSAHRFERPLQATRQLLKPQFRLAYVQGLRQPSDPFLTVAKATVGEFTKTNAFCATVEHCLHGCCQLAQPVAKIDMREMI